MASTSFSRGTTKAQARVLAQDLGFDEGGRFSLLAVTGYEIDQEPDTFGTVFSIIDCVTGEEVEQSPLASAVDVRAERQHMIARVLHLNGREDPYA